MAWFLALFLLQSSGHAADVTVRPTDDVAALTSALGPGDVVTFEDGTYQLTGTLHWTGQGTEAAPIVLQAAPGATPVLEQTVSGWVAEVNDATYLEVRGLTFQGASDWETNWYGGLRLGGTLNASITVADCTMHSMLGTGLRVTSNAQFITLSGLHIFDITDSSGIYVGCGDATCWMQDSTVSGNHIHDLTAEGAYGLYFAHGTQNVTIRDNTVYRVGSRALFLGSTELAQANLVEGNAFWSTGGDGILLEGAATVRNNLIFSTVGYGIRVQDTRDTLEAAVIVHNTIVDTEGYGIRLDDWADRDDMVLANNVVSNPTGLAFQYPDLDSVDDTTSHIVGNVFSGFVDDIDPELHPDWFIPGGGYLDFVDVEAFDFYPSEASTLRDAADTLGLSAVPEVDFNDFPRPPDAPDVGAYEWSGESNPGWAVSEGFKEPGYGTDVEEDEVGGGCCSREDDEAPQAALLLLAPLGLGWTRRRRRVAKKSKGVAG